MTVSVIIPALNESRALPATLRALLRQSDFHEAIVVDGGSTDATCSVVRHYTDQLPGIRLIEAPPGRGSQMNAGAREASGDWLLFLHADTLLPPNALSLITNLTNISEIKAGCFRQRFFPSNLRLRMISAAHNLRFRLSGIIYGDQAMFVRSDLFHQLGAFPEQTMEDVIFSERLLNHTKPVMLPAAVQTDSRKFRQIGELRALWWVFGILLNYQAGKPIAHTEFFRNYR